MFIKHKPSKILDEKHIANILSFFGRAGLGLASVQAQTQTVFSVDAYGASTNSSNSGPAIRAAIQAAAGMVPARVTFGPGTYHSRPMALTTIV